MTQTFEATFFSRQITYFAAKDITALLRQYHDDAVLVRVNTIIRGQAAIGQFLTECLEQYGDLQLQAIQAYNEVENVVFAQLLCSSANGNHQEYYLLILRNGKIAYDIIVPLPQAQPNDIR